MRLRWQKGIVKEAEPLFTVDKLVYTYPDTSTIVVVEVWCITNHLGYIKVITDDRGFPRFENRIGQHITKLLNDKDSDWKIKKAP